MDPADVCTCIYTILYITPVTLHSYFTPVLRSEKEFHDAAKRNDTERMQELIRRGVDIRVKNKVRYNQYRNIWTMQSYMQGIDYVQ